MRYTLLKTGEGRARRRFSPGIRLKLIAFLIPLVFLLVATLAAAVTKITDAAIRRDILQRGAAVSRIVALSAGFSLLSGDRLAMDSLASKTKQSSEDIEYVAVRDTGNIVLAHSRISDRGKVFDKPTHATPLGVFQETEAKEVSRDGRDLIEFTTPILFKDTQVGTVSVGISKESLLLTQRNIRRSIIIASSALLGIALLGTLILASYITTPVKKLSSGVNELASGSTFHPIPVRAGDELGELTRNFNRMAETILQQKNRLSSYAKEVEEAYVGIVRVVAASIDARDPYTLGHSTRVARISREMGKQLGFSGEELEHLEKACLFHDVGKIRTPDNILLKQQTLTHPEAEEMRSHPTDGAEILMMAPSLQRYVPVVMMHHEWFDGSGYPYGKRNSEIPIHAQIIALADAFDAMTTTRPYRAGLSPEEAVEEILRHRGTQFSPMLTDVFVRLAREIPLLETEEWRGMAL
ncbi:MAG TPA: HD domain-containing phosphohydrolase [Candidatus Limnocylindrales bacterium]|nr:HD domain-containing phosphohydrolase [Candidatus Limnocylindrales bacterium]